MLTNRPNIEEMIKNNLYKEEGSYYPSKQEKTSLKFIRFI